MNKSIGETDNLTNNVGLNLKSKRGIESTKQNGIVGIPESANPNNTQKSFFKLNPTKLPFGNQL